jgi:hypothetical protein
MPLKIFISSVYRELHEERQALHKEVLKLQDLFVGMEFFGSDPGKPADYCVQQVEASDLYVGLFGDDYGSVDEATGKSFTQLEYEAAVNRHIPCLIYFKASIAGRDGGDVRLAALKENLSRSHIVYPFKDTGDLKLQFLIDFIKLLRTTLFDKSIPLYRGPIPANALLSLTKGFIREQIEEIGRDKYISEVYVTRGVEGEIARFIQFESTFRERVAMILEYMDSIRAVYGLGDEAALAVSRAKVGLHDVHGETLRAAVDELKRAFYFREVEEAVEAANSLIMEPSNERFHVRAGELSLRWRGKPFIEQARLSSAELSIGLERQRSLTAGALQTNLTYRKFLRLFPSHVDEEKYIHTANDLLKELTRLVELSLKRCLVLVDKAGTGKTNVACRTAEQLAGEHPVVLLGGQMQLSSEYDIEKHIKERLESAFSGMFSDWMNRVSPGLQASQKWLFIIIDGINENSQRPLFIRLLRGLLPRLEERRVKLILTCRDLFWDVFRPTLEPYIFEDVVLLHEFSEAEWLRAVEAYFKWFNVKCSLDKEAREALRNPLLLRFFCEAHRNRELGRVSNLRLRSVFDQYVGLTCQSIAERHDFLTRDSVLQVLLGVARAMWEQRSASVSLASTGVGQQETGEGTSAYSLVLSENIIFEEVKHAYSTRKSVRFLYDEFMEYMIARSWFEEISESADERAATTRLLQDAAGSFGSFPPALGAVLFLDQMREGEGRLVNEFVVSGSKMGDLFLNSQQTSLLYAFESANFAHADSEIIEAVEKFEPTVREDLRERLASVILKILKAHPDEQFAKNYVYRVLEVGQQAGAGAGARKAGGKRGRAGKSAREPVRPLAPAWMSRENAELRGWRYVEERKEPPRLPPGRYHHTEETKINAIGLLVQLKSGFNYEAIEEGIRRLGRTDLHSALQAWQYLDLASDELIYQTVADYIDASQPEYRIYCAWLLRGRYGKEPANFLARLLCDAETRVHQYAAEIFESRFIERRLIEGELIEEMLRRIGPGGDDLKTWHMSRFVKLLGKREQFHPRGLAESYGPKIVSALSALLGHRHSSLRLELYRTIAAFPSFINFDDLKKRMQQDEDIYVRSLGDKLTPRA